MKELANRANPYWAAALPLVAVSAVGLRWLLQGSGNVYTDLNKRFYVPDEAIGWASANTDAVWLGLDSLAIIALLLAGVAGAAWFIRRRERKNSQPWSGARFALWPVALLALIIPAWAFASGSRPTDGRDFLPAGLSQAPKAGIKGRLEGAPRGTYKVVAGGKSVVAVRLHAGGEEFEARFTGALKGWWRGDPGDLHQPMRAQIEVLANSVDTGITKRTTHAFEFLDVGKHPKVRFTLDKLTAAEPDDKGRIRFAANGHLELMGARMPVKLTGLMWSPKGDALNRLGVTGPTLVISAGFSLDLNETPLSKDMDSFDRAAAPVAVTLVLTLDKGTQGDKT